MLVLGIETSCDETAVAVVKDGKEILSSVVLSQTPLHKSFYGVVPEVASRAHAFWLLPTVESSLEKAKISPRQLSAVGVTQGPGLIGALMVGLTAAKTIAAVLGIPLVPVSHLSAHIYSAFMSTDALPPAVALVVSGGHTALFRINSLIDSEVLGRTTDDAAGEAFDKVARMLALPYPGGPSIERASEGGSDTIKFPRAMLGEESLDFSFSGMKTAVLYHIRERKKKNAELTESEVANIAASFQEAVVDVLVEKSKRALVQTSLKRLVVVGGVAANR
ncbi:MAG: tRNA (adenosine(37)-N6)-threonylcarbamoyltransferase complex transferase subunit TsaD, partial [Planctomycetota bacterium]|nr:tRNA (adenosine(37)-N6)-threonylcarbamoyltransferase complex transferase subunit TsaD [Planctomycetota bacterium]